MKKALLTITCLLLLSGCSQRAAMVHPGFYQQGHYQPSQSQPAYYDAYGRLHTAQENNYRYQAGRYHRPSYQTPSPQPSTLAGYGSSNAWWSQTVLIGAVGGAALAGVLLDGGLTSLVAGAAAGAYTGQMLQQNMGPGAY